MKSSAEAELALYIDSRQKEDLTIEGPLCYRTAIFELVSYFVVGDFDSVRGVQVVILGAILQATIQSK